MRYVEVTKALYDYEARTEDELSIKEDDILYVIEKEDEDWWRAELKQPNAEEQGPVGLVPASYLEEITPLGKVRAEFDYQAQQEEELSFQEGEEMTLLETDDPDWYLVKLNDGQIGLAPSNYVQMEGEEFEDAQPEQYEPEAIPAAAPPQPSLSPVAPPVQASIPATPIQASIPPPPVQPILSQPTGSVTSLPREIINDDAQSWNVHEYDAAKKKKKKSKGSLFVGNGMICYGSETDKSLPVQQYPILDVTKYLYDGKNLHIEVEGAKQAILDFQASSKSEAKAILAKISDSARAAQMSNTHLHSPEKQIAAPAAAIPPRTGSSRIEHQEPEPQHEEEEEESNCVPKWGISLYSFRAEGGDELSVEENEQIYVLDYERTDGWWRVQKVDGDIGLVPSSYVQFDGEEHADNVEDIRQQREDEERALQQQRIAEEQQREQQRKREQEERERKRREDDERRRQEDERRRKEEDARRKEEEARRREEESRRREEQRRREEEDRERQRQAAEAAKKAEAARQKQIEEDYKRKEAERKAQLARSSSTSKNRYQDLPKPDPKKIRTWTDRSGSFKVEAQFIDFHNGKLRLHKLNGVKIDVPVEKMCAEDVRWVEDHTRNHEEPEITPAMPPRPQQSAPPPAPIQPLAPAQPQQKKFNERWDWFDWFMLIGIPMQASLQYASAFKADKLDDSDIQKLTHKQMKSLGIKEEHVRRIERYIETGRPEDLNEEEADNKKKQEQDQISKDEELARKLQKEWENTESSQTSRSVPSSNGRPRPNVSAPKDVHPDLLDFIGTQLSSDTGKGKEPEKPKGGDLLGFNDDAWAPRKDNSPIAALAPTKITSTPTAATATPPPPPQPTGPTPEELKAQEAERRRIQEEEQIQKIQLLSLQKQTNEQKKQLEELQKLTQQQIDLQKQIAMQTGTQQQQHMLQMQAQQAQLQQAQLQQQLAPQFPQLQTSYTNQFNNAQPTGFNSQPTGFNSQPTGFNSQPTGFNNQPSIFNNSQATGFNSQPTGINNGRPRPTPNSSLIQDLTLGQWQPNQQQQSQPTGFQSNALVPQHQQQQNAWQGLQPQMTGLPPSNGGFQPQQPQQLPPPLAPSTAGQQNVFNNNGLVGVQPTGRHWNNSTPANPFGSPTLSSPLQAQMTGVQFSTPSPQAFNSSPLQNQPVNNVFTPQGSMQYGQSAFPSQRPW